MSIKAEQIVQGGRPHPSSDILHHPLGRGDEGSKTIPERGEERLKLNYLFLIAAPQGDEKDEGCRIISSVDLLARSRSQATDSTQRQLWGLHVRVGAVTLFIGETSVGKTVFLHNLAYHLATGREFLGITPPRPLRVLHVDFESYDDIFADHLSTIGTADRWRFVEQDHLDERGPALMQKVATSVRSNQYDVVIIDPLMEAYPLESENDNAEANKQMLAFRNLARETNAGVIVVHNSGLRKDKSKKGSEKFLGRGATSRVDRADVSINFTSEGPTTRRLFVAKARGKNLNEEIRFRFAGNLGYELISSSSQEPAVLDTLDSEILALMECKVTESRHEVERKTILGQLNPGNSDAREQAIDRALRKLVKLEKLGKEGKGIYRLRASAPGRSPSAEDVSNPEDCTPPTYTAEGRAGDDGEPEAAPDHREAARCRAEPADAPVIHLPKLRRSDVRSAAVSDGPTHPPIQSPMYVFAAGGLLQPSERRPGRRARSQPPGGSPRRPCVDLGS